MSRIHEALRRAGAEGRETIAPWNEGTEKVSTVSAREARSIPEDYAEIAAALIQGGPVLPFDQSNVRVAEQYRMLRTNIVQHSAKPKVIAVSSACPGDGKTLTAINLAGILAMKADTRVLLVDADLRQCTVARALDITPDYGFAEVLSGECPASSAIVRIKDFPGLHVLASGRAAHNPAELLDSVLCQDLISRFREEFSYVIVDTTPVTAVADYRLIEQLVDGVVLVVRPDHTHRATLQRLLEQDLSKKLLGAIVNGFEDWFLWHAPDTYGYYGRYAAPSKPRRSLFGRR